MFCIMMALIAQVELSVVTSKGSVINYNSVITICGYLVSIKIREVRVEASLVINKG